MIRWLLCIPDSANPENFLLRALTIIQPQDELVILKIIENIDSDLFPYEMNAPIKEYLRREALEELKLLDQICKTRQVNSSIVVCEGEDPLIGLCLEATKTKPDFVIFGRKAGIFHKVKKFILGKNSSYCDQNGNCDLVIISPGTNDISTSTIESPIKFKGHFKSNPPIDTKISK